MSFLLAGGAFFGISAAYIDIDQVDMEATERCIGISASFTGLPQSDTYAFAQYRLSGAADWQTGADLVRATKSPTTRYIGSILYMDPGTAFDVRVIIADSGGVVDTAQRAITTAAWQFPEDTGSTYYVATYGNDKNQVGLLRKRQAIIIVA